MPGTRDRRHLRLIKAGRAKPWRGRVRESHRDLIIPLECVLPERERDEWTAAAVAPLRTRGPVPHEDIRILADDEWVVEGPRDDSVLPLTVLTREWHAEDWWECTQCLPYE